MEMQQDDNRLGWLAYVLDEGLRLGVLHPANVLAHATPEVLAGTLPRELMVKVFATAFSTGKLTPEGILGVAPPSTLVKFVAPHIVWTCVREAAVRGQMATASALPKGKSPQRVWISAVVARGLLDGIFNPADVARHIPPRDWVREVPVEVVARMIASGLSKPTFDPAMALEVLTPATIGEFVAPHLAWAIVDEGAVRAFHLGDSAGHTGTSAAADATA